MRAERIVLAVAALAVLASAACSSGDSPELRPAGSGSASAALPNIPYGQPYTLMIGALHHFAVGQPPIHGTCAKHQSALLFVQVERRGSQAVSSSRRFDLAYGDGKSLRVPFGITLCRGRCPGDQ